MDDTETGVTFSKSDGVITGFSCDVATFKDDYSDGFVLENAASGMLVDVNNNKVLFAQNAFELRAPASLTKIMTAYLALKYCSMDETVVIGTEAVNISDPTATRLGVNLGDKMTMDQALNLCLIPSSNDIAIAIGCHISGTEEEFAKLMTEEAVALGATSTNFTDACGLGSDTHLTTAYDMYLIFSEALKDQRFRDIIQKKEYQTTYKDRNDKDVSATVRSTNLYFRGDVSMPDSITIMGAKTGTTTEAGSCLLLLAQDKFGNPYIAIILGADTRDLLYKQMTDLLIQITN
ncbi:MAG: D-alanyl-D-alanine carboxypeptidase [Lachnospiraceae bacterium]|nr:D-alanyl-D-alanine carboxypeptidase [Lachnospiraceae bacterium]